MDVLGFNQLGQVLLGAAHFCGQAGITIAGGHSIADSAPKFGLFVYGVVHPQNIIDNIAAVPVDLLVLTKKIGKGILTTAEKRGQVPNTGLS